MKKVFIRTAFNYDMDEVSDETGLKCMDPSLADDSQREESDINTLITRFGLGAELPTSLRVPKYGDYEGISDFQEAMNVIRDAEVEFMSMPAKLRARFHNSPQEFLEFFGDEANRAEAIRLGLVADPVVAASLAAVPVAPPAPPAPSAATVAAAEALREGKA